jgi:hypothetical protein
MNYTRITFAGYSMYPAIRPGDTLILEIAAARDCALGDIVCVGRENEYVVHRIVGIDRVSAPPRIITKGDSLTYSDRPVPLPADGIPRVVMVSRAYRGLIRPRRGRLTAALSRANLTRGIVRGRIAHIVRKIRDRFVTLFELRSTVR